MSITNLASYAGMVTYGLAPLGLALQRWGLSYPPDKIECVKKKPEGKGALEQKNDAPEGYMRADLTPDNTLVTVGKTMQQVAAGILLIKVGIDAGLTGDYVIPSAMAVGTLAVFAGGPVGSKLDKLVTRESLREKFKLLVDLSVLTINLINILVINGSSHIKMGGPPRQIWVGSSMAATTALSLFVCMKV